jgi:hypothetical protein
MLTVWRMSSHVSKATTRHHQDPEILFGWKEIANFPGCGSSHRTAPRTKPWSASSEGRRQILGAVMATLAEFEAWVSARPLAGACEMSDKPRPSLAWNGWQAGIERMQRRMDETNPLKNEIRATVRTLRSSISRGLFRVESTAPRQRGSRKRCSGGSRT